MATVGAHVGRVEAATRRAVQRMKLETGSSAEVLGEAAVSLACATDAATAKGSASAAAMSARELRETLAALATVLDGGPDEDPFDRLAREMRESVEASGDGR